MPSEERNARMEYSTNVFCTPLAPTATPPPPPPPLLSPIGRVYKAERHR
jgi:hypothetical protein